MGKGTQDTGTVQWQWKLKSHCPTYKNAVSIAPVRFHILDMYSVLSLQFKLSLSSVLSVFHTLSFPGGLAAFADFFHPLWESHAFKADYVSPSEFLSMITQLMDMSFQWSWNFYKFFICSF